MLDKRINLIDDQHLNEDQQVQKTRRLIFLTLFISFLLIFAGCVTRTIIGQYAPTDPHAYDPITLEPKKPEGLLQKITYFLSKDNNLSGWDDDRINILLLGIGGAGHDGPYLTDTIILASIQPSSGKIALISIPAT